MSNNCKQTTCDLVMESEIYSHSCEINWEINSFSRHKDDITSCEFSPVESCCTRWHIYVHFTESDMQVGVKLLSEDVNKITPLLHVTIKNSKGDIFEKKSTNETSDPWCTVMKRPLKTEPVESSFGKNGLFQILDDDVLLVHAVIELKGCCYVNKMISCKAEGKDVNVVNVAKKKNSLGEDGFVMV